MLKFFKGESKIYRQKIRIKPSDVQGERHNQVVSKKRVQLGRPQYRSGGKKSHPRGGAQLYIFGKKKGVGKSREKGEARRFREKACFISTWEIHV